MFQLIFSCFHLIGNIPRKWAGQWGNLIGRLWFAADKKHRQIAIDNLTHAFGNERNADQIRQLALQVFENLSQMLFEIGWTLHLKPEDFPTYFHIEGLENIRQAYQKNKGVLALTAHIGNWELLPIIAASLERPVNILYRPLDFSPMDQFFIHIRTRFGSKVIPTAHSMRKILGCLKRGEIVAMLADQNVDWYEGVFVDYFGRRACTSKGLALLALKTQSPVIPVFLVRTESGFTAEFGPEIPLIRTGDKLSDIEENTQQYNLAIENFVRRYPTQGFWVHQRWKTKPYCMLDKR